MYIFQKAFHMVAIADWVDNIHCKDHTLKSQVSSLNFYHLNWTAWSHVFQGFTLS